MGNKAEEGSGAHVLAKLARLGGGQQGRPPRGAPRPGRYGALVPAPLQDGQINTRRAQGHWASGHQHLSALRNTLEKIKKRQQDVVRFLEANRIEFEEVDITMSEEKRQWMYKNIPEDRQPAQGNPLPPQIFSDDRYCGDYDGFFESKESNTVFSFLGLKPTLASK
ncbi:SH3 domain-binding glutamic acid-rich-like protein 2 [Manacus vitellinus]|uniref:SH3 domain-binding glutamic acid-rich-like protein 2 n=1 Tax=Manacus vitellinus TaxID=328815 RepID=UPI00115EA32B|nr:SH3 domain-binding glutamic acid-rich-like protein 2 [Manacus vitellinus]